MAEHTKGPWKIGKQTGHMGIGIMAGEDGEVMIVNVYLFHVNSSWEWGEETFNQPDNAEALANAYLVAAAPKLLEIAKKTRQRLASTPLHTPEEFILVDEMIHNLTVVIKEAEGNNAHK